MAHPTQSSPRLPLVPPGTLAVDEARFPDIADLAARLRFSPADGRIWLDDQRMLLINSGAMGVLRRELIETLGVPQARELLTRMGYFAGTRDAEIARRARPNEGLKAMFSVGPQLHALEGVVLVEPVALQIDVERGTHYGEFYWKSSSEDEEHTRHFGVATEPMCWMQIGYASGFTSQFMGKPVLYRELECQSMGHPHCRIVGKPVQDWGDEAADDLRYFRMEDFSRVVDRLATPPRLRPRLPGVAAWATPAAATDFCDLGERRMVGASPAYQSACQLIRRVADTAAPVLFHGEGGVGKEMFARALHSLGARRQQPFVAVSCAAMAEAQLEAELFGVERSALTGLAGHGVPGLPGRIERADGGTLFLDEVSALGVSAQARLLRLLQDGELERLGDLQSRRVDVRVLASTTRDLRREVQAGRLREDLYFRLHVFPVHVPPLRDRREDVPVLLDHVLRRCAARHGRVVDGFSQRAFDALLMYGWPGNIRELENKVERAVLLAVDGGTIDLDAVFSHGDVHDAGRWALAHDGTLAAADRMRHAPARDDDPDVGRAAQRLSDLLLDAGDDDQVVPLEDIEFILLRKAVARANGNLAAAARLLGITRPQLAYRLKSRGLAAAGE